jgi:hypothetical protein
MPKGRRWARAALVVRSGALALAAGTCGGGAPVPTVQGVLPQRAHTDTAIRLTIDAAHLRPAVSVDVQDGLVRVVPDSVRFALVAEAGGRPPVALGDVTWLGGRRFTARIPPGIEEGHYALHVTGPDGATAVSRNAFESLGPDRLAPQAPSPNAFVGAGLSVEAIVLVDDGDGMIAAVDWRTPEGDHGTCDLSSSSFAATEDAPAAQTAAGQAAAGQGAAENERLAPSRLECTFTFMVGPLSNEALDVEPFHLDISATDVAGNVGELRFPLQRARRPEIVALSQTVGSLAGLQALTIQGRYFLPGTMAFIGQAPLAGPTPGGERLGDTLIVGLTPPQTRPGPVPVEVRSPAGATVAPTLFTYVEAPRPREVQPSRGPARGGIRVTVRGNDLRAGVEISFGASRESRRPLLNVSYQGNNKLVGCLPPGSGAVSVWAADAVTGEGVLHDGFVYDDALDPVPPPSPADGTCP